MRLGVLVSGRGSNLEAVLRAWTAGSLPGIEPALVISNRPGVPALAVAASFGVAHRVLARRDFGAAGERDRAIAWALTDAGVELALLAGYDQLLGAPYFAIFAGRTINIHPSLLPRHGGRGMVGEAVHRAVLAAGDAETGVTIHEVTAALDDGPILAQRRLAVRAGESVAELAGRVLRLEHRCLVALLAQLARGPLTGHPGRESRPTGRGR